MCIRDSLKDFFRAYKEFNDEQLDTLEIILTKLYKNFGITDYTDYDKPVSYTHLDVYKRQVSWYLPLTLLFNIRTAGQIFTELR